MAYQGTKGYREAPHDCDAHDWWGTAQSGSATYPGTTSAWPRVTAALENGEIFGGCNFERMKRGSVSRKLDISKQFISTKLTTFKHVKWKPRRA